ncbi:MAG: 16S rRNA pseudouridine(516) synthase [Oscillospiraceae bacterium]|nr:16S rRNA pseudouridine(516) synthase [Oscillospiraceae bacterium]
MGQTRLDKRICDSGRWTRSEARALIRAGRVQVDGAVVRAPEEKAPDGAEITVDGAPLDCRRTRYLMLYKPAGLLSATEDRDQQTVLDLLAPELRRLGLFPVGRLDKDTTGLLLLTNDGDWAHRVTAPRSRVPKRYRAVVDGTLDGTDEAALAAGLTLGDGTQCLPARLERTERPDTCYVTVFEGRYHQVKRMLAALGKPVLRLHRERIGALALDCALAPGQYRELTEAERAAPFQAENGSK